MNLENFVLNAIRSARRQGLTESNPVAWNVLSNSDTGVSTVKRLVTVSYAPPPLFEGNEVQLWINPAEAKLYKSSNWRDPANPMFQETTDFGSVFAEPANQVPPDVATKQYVNDVLAELQNQGMVSVVSAPVQNLAALRALSVAAMPDKQLIFVEDEHQMFAYDFQSVATEDSYTVRPASGVGRWVATGPSKMDAGVF